MRLGMTIKAVREGHEPNGGHERAGEVGLCVVPMNQSNKEAQASAEAGEGRAQTRENIVPSHMRPTQSGKRMSQGLHGVRPAARFAAIYPQ